jgi:hypothetical protein
MRACSGAPPCFGRAACTAARGGARRVAGIFLGLLVALAAVPAVADWKDDYARGLEAVKDGKWQEVARYMQSAIAANATPAARVRLYGQRYETYAPQYYAGLAAYRLGDCGGALRYWDSPAAKGFRGGAEFGATEAKARSDCSARLAKAESPPSTVPAPPSSKPGTPPAGSTPDTTKPSGGTKPANQVAVNTPQRPPVQTPPKPPVQQAPAKPVNPSDALRPLIDAYLAGKYADAIRLADRVNVDGRLRWHVQLLKAAAAFGQAGLGDDGAALATARAAVAEARRLDASRRPDPAFFSPRFLAFYDGRQ